MDYVIKMIMVIWNVLALVPGPVQLVQNQQNPCAESVDKFHTNWSKTAESTLVTLTCTGEYTGNVSRYCSSVGKWRYRTTATVLTAKLLSGAGEYNNVTIILIGLENITRDNNDLRSGDLLTSSSILNDIAKYVTEQKEKLSVDQLEGSGGVTPLVNAVTEFNDAFNDVIESNFSLVAVKENVVMEVGRASSDEIIVPDRSETNGTWISDSRTEIKLKLEKKKCSGLTGYSSTFYRNVSGLFPEYLLLNGKVKSFNGSYDVNSIIADFTIHGSSCSNYTLIIKFDHLFGDYIRPFCGHWDFNASDVSDDGTKVLMNLCVALIISYVIFLAGITQTENKVVCSVIAVAMHYIFLTDFALMLAEVLPAVIVGISAGVTKLKGYGNHKYCWLSPETNLIWAFIGPALLVITINVIVIIITVYKMMTVKALATKTPKENPSKYVISSQFVWILHWLQYPYWYKYIPEPI
ncbi:ADGRB1 [Mytilus edulis]|uniref:ADGRB1 n=1 Tax=Mytilus edulis TaxID=6550 RepID=A0A8S3TTH7_MYTED|nr:ADGRB1 [Mytilus edulis]